MTRNDAETLAHRAVVAASVLGLGRGTLGLRVTVTELSRAPGAASADVVVVTDDEHDAEGELARAMARHRAALGDGRDGVVALVVASPITRALVAAARPDLVTALEGRDDAYARAVVWASARPPPAALVPALHPERLGAFLEAAAASDLTLVEPDLAASAPGVARLRGMRSPRARALVATVATGACVRPLLFIPSHVAPKGGLARAKVERLADGWVTASPTAHGPAAATDIVTAALAVLRDRVGPTPFKDLLREARERWTSEARAAGGRATPSSADARELAAALWRLGGTEDVTLFARDPADPGWTLTLL